MDIITAKGRVQAKLDELRADTEKLGNLLGKVRSENWKGHEKLLEKLSGEQKKLLAKQYRTQKELIRIYEKRLKLWTEE